MELSLPGEGTQKELDLLEEELQKDDINRVLSILDRGPLELYFLETLSFDGITRARINRAIIEHTKKYIDSKIETLKERETFITVTDDYPEDAHYYYDHTIEISSEIPVNELKIAMLKNSIFFGNSLLAVSLLETMEDKTFIPMPILKLAVHRLNIRSSHPDLVQELSGILQ